MPTYKPNIKLDPFEVPLRDEPKESPPRPVRYLRTEWFGQRERLQQQARLARRHRWRAWREELAAWLLAVCILTTLGLLLWWGGVMSLRIRDDR